ncbi:hypothetical protein [Meridianimarinicoccus aquatilis]|uniref:Uncharacterized protein n=1 Tax=Meridianimarinicoccus aquatilis TaxID=2552766 RepID=A0A4R6AXZ1_9RHOB|nr:hypothetical protein [Fluviibacterium aquatile]TDL89150.1 hypothetical protein E2L05_07750 [Fluviibacterium aquatile]
MTCEVRVETLAGLRLPQSFPLRRDHVVAQAHQTADYLAKYDRRTLFYDCQYDTARGQFLITAPRLLNLWPVLRDGLRIGGRPVRGLRRKVFPKCEIISAKAPLGPVSVVFEESDLTVSPRRLDTAPFNGANAIITMSKNNPLDWIADWARFYVKAHGLTAVLFIDNGSDTYTPAQLTQTLAAVDGLHHATILSAPFAYGPLVSGRAAKIKPNFLKSAMLNMARCGPLSRANAVLNVDIDELVQGPEGTSLFDAARSAWHGTLNIGGEFVFPAPGTSGPAPQRVHTFRAIPPRISTRKWAARPTGILSKMGWFVHQVGGEPFRLVPESRDFRLVHCSAANLNWFRGPDSAQTDTLRPDATLHAMMDQVFND